ncbi:hypothetical protein [Bacillus toyonensis]|uniref:hypothetical protein n=1 Tax=Bacillus toyonensis TaxID=155322 RepID=UPI002E1AAB55|nr:hypothetical protein [Bacillus toyonensis]
MRINLDIQNKWKQAVAEVNEVTTKDLTQIQWIERDDNCYDDEWHLIFNYQNESYKLEYFAGEYTITNEDHTIPGWSEDDIAILSDAIGVYNGDLLEDLYNHKYKVKPSQVFSKFESMMDYQIKGAKQEGCNMIITYLNPITNEELQVRQSLVETEFIS